MPKNNDQVKVRPMALIGKVLCVACDPGDKIFDVSVEPERFLGIVQDGIPVINHKAKTVYLSIDDYRAAKAALPNGPSPLTRTTH